MNKRLEDFIQKNKEAFDNYEPSDALWQRIERELGNKNRSQKGQSVSMKTWIKVAAAVIFLVMGAASWYSWNRVGKSNDAIVASVANSAETAPVPLTPEQPEEAPLNNPHSNTAPVALNEKEKKSAPAPRKKENELYHYSRLIELRQDQMEILKTSEPELYQEFSKDMDMLATSYDALKAQLERGVNREKLMEAMIGNLKMQSELLSRQLDILKQVQSKKEKDETNYKNL